MADPRCGCEEQMTFSIIISDVTGLFSRPEKERTIHLPCQKVILSMYHIFTFSNVFL